MKKIVIFIATIFLLSISVFAAPTVSVNKYLNNKNLMIKKAPTAIKLSKAEDPSNLSPPPWEHGALATGPPGKSWSNCSQ